MAYKVGELYALLTLKDQGFKKGLENAESSMSRAASMSKTLLAGVAAAGAGFVAAATKGVILAGQMEQTKIAFTTLLGSAKEADAFLKQLWDFAARTPFEFEGLAQSSRQLLAFGFQAKEIIPLMTAVGDAISALGGGAAEIDRVIRALGQMRAKGKVSAEEMMQLAELGIPAWEMLAQAIGTSIPEAMEKASKGAIPAAVGINAIVQGMAKRFEGSMEQQSRTLLGRWSTLQDNISGILRSLGEEIIRTFNLGGVLDRVNDALGAISDTLREGGLRGLAQMAPPWLAGAILAVAGALTGALIPGLIDLTKRAYMAARAAVLALGPWAAAGAAIALAGYLIWRNWDKVRPVFERLRSAAEPALKAIRDAVADVVSYIQANWPKIQATLATFFNWLKPILGVVFGGALFMVKNFVAGVATLMRGWITIVSGIVKAIAAVLAGDWSTAWESVKQIFRGAIQVITGMLRASFMGQILAVLGALAGRVIEWAKGPWGALVNAVQGAVQWISDIIRDAKGVFTALWDVITGGPAEVEYALEYLGQVFGGVFWYIGDVIARAREWFGRIVEFVKALPGQIAAILPQLPEIIAHWIGMAVGFAIRIIQNLPVWAHKAMVALVNAFVRGLTAAKNWAVTLVTNLVRAVVNWFATLPGRVAAWVANMQQRVVTWFNLTKARVVNAVVTAVTAVVNWFRSLPGRVAAVIAALPGRVASYFNRAKGQALASANSMYGGVRQALNRIPGIFSDIFNRVWSIISGWPTKLWNKAKSIAESFWSGFKKGLGIRSPSYVERAFMAMEKQATETVENMRRTTAPLEQFLSRVAAPALDLVRGPAMQMMAPRLPEAAPTVQRQLVIVTSVQIDKREVGRAVAPVVDEVLGWRQRAQQRALGVAW